MSWHRLAFAALTLVLIQIARAQGSTPPASAPGTTERPVLTAQPKPGDKLGLPYEQAVQRLDPEVRRFLDGVLRVYKEQGLVGNRKATLEALGAKVAKRNYFDTEGQPRPVFREDFASTGVYGRKGWSGHYYYRGVNRDNTKWEFRIEVLLDPKTAECVDSRAVEGYVDLYWVPIFNTTVHKPYVRPDEWDRHDKYGAMRARALLPITPNLEMGIVKGCLVRIEFTRTISLEEMSNEHIYD